MATNTELTKIKQKRRVAKAGFTRVENFIKSIEPQSVDVEEIKLRLNKLDELWKTLEETLTELVIHNDSVTDEQIDLELINYEEKYVHLRLAGERVIKERSRPACAFDELNQATLLEMPRVRSNDGHVRLPKIELPSFTGAYEEWHSFYNTFNSLIHSNNSLNEIQKFHYLKSAVKGEVAETIASLEISEVHYNDAWVRLRDRYDNERVAVQEHIKAIFELPSLKRENSVTLRSILDGVLKHTRALAALGRPTDQWGDLLIYIVTSKLDFITMKEWEVNIEARKMPDFRELIEFLTKRCQMLEAVARRSLPTPSNESLRSFKTGKATVVHAATSNIKCAECKGDHPLYQCKTFKELSITERLNKVKSLRLCLNCLKGKHFAKDCLASGCKKCSKKHSTLLHIDESSKDEKDRVSNQKSTREVDANKTVDTICTHAQAKEILKTKQVLLSTALVKVKAARNLYVEGRALLDNGSQSNFVTEEFVRRLKLPTVNERIEIKGINKHVSQATKTVSLSIKSRFGSSNVDFSCIVLPRITQNLPNVPVELGSLEVPKNIRLADPKFNVPSKIDLLIGAELFWDLICVGQIKLGKHKPTLQKSLLGWLVTGSVTSSNSSNMRKTSCHLSIMEQLNETMRKFWEIENCSNKRGEDPEEEYCVKHFSETYSRCSNGRFVVKLPVKEEIINSLQDSREIALKRFLSLERKFDKNPMFKLEYIKFMQEYIRLGHMKRVTNPNESALKVYLPHHAVTKPSSGTTKTRVVFDASCRYSKGKSLNDALYKGPVLQAELFELLIRFRCFKYVLCADITKMYRQILVAEEQTSLQTVLWRENPNVEIEEFELVTVTYGTKPASFLAIKCLHQLAEIERKNYPKASEIVQNDLYMDDLLTGADSEDEILKLKDELTELLSKGGFELHKWNSNVPALCNTTNSHDKVVNLSKITEERLLGVYWNANNDFFHYKVSLETKEARVTKRVILSQIAKLFDPLGLVGPVITLAKILMQELWHLGVDWDESVPMRIHKCWEQIKLELSLLNSLKIGRPVVSGGDDSQIQLHGFCDASEKAYGACVYIRELNSHGGVVVSLICSKSRVAPMKTTSLPRLELCGAILLVNLIERVTNILRIKPQRKVYWTDSTIVLAWINSSSRKWQTFVANRVSEIHDKSSPSEWRHVRSKGNPADWISRGATPEQLIKTNEWWEGPTWLKESENCWPKVGEDLSIRLPEERKNAVIAAAVIKQPTIDYKRFSSFTKLLRVIAYILRFSANTRSRVEGRKGGPISTVETNQAKSVLIKLVQHEEFRDERRALKNSNKIARTSRLLALHPYLDEEDILRVGGRLKHATIRDETKHPILLPASHPVTTLLITHYHEELLHAGALATINTIREEFWPIFLRSQVKKILRKCVKCRKASPKASWQIMGELPAVRVNRARPFSNAGVDYCGPFYVRDRARRNSKRYKAYIAIFVCMVTKAVHIELVEDLTTDSFLAALKRLIARRGKIQNIYSDNGRNFVGADRELQRLLQGIGSKEELQQFATNERLNWHFIPARSPHHGGLWEAAVRAMKLQLKKIIGESCLTVAELSTVLCQVEAMLNSRPLTPISEDPNDLRALTPGHFLIGENLQSYPELNVQELPRNTLSRWQHVEQLRQHWWSRWQREYLTSCQQRTKWKTEGSARLRVGQLVMLKESEGFPLKWVLARITEVHPGKDGTVRTVTVRTSKGIYKRATVNVSPLCED